ncbi:MAG TPA: hypothetical protein VK533_08640 [Sphingomonas sp.]|uniref:hypothetical protein n=1 Tax=Sphingomonas sp. TaxID=28214 RepID=UPI002D037AAD|nr:hypothetical protein [Sphingomonas sp.]HMI19596.1 hypothetical protein [Sphingomonas sp.]
MGNIKGHVAFKAALFCCAWAFSEVAPAAVFVCTNESCSTWAAITATQLALKSNDPSKTAISAALSNSTQDSVTNGYNSAAGTNLYLKSSLWHEGGDDPFKGFDHVTAYVFKNGAKVKTCHVFSYAKVLKGPYFATCA